MLKECRKRICEAYCQELLQIAPKVTQKALACDMGLEIPKSHIYKKFNIPKPEDGEEVLKPPQNGVAMGQPSPMETAEELKLKQVEGQTEQVQVDTIVSVANKQAEGIFREMVKPIFKMIDKAEDMEELQKVLKDEKKLRELYQEMESPELEDLIQQGMRWKLKKIVYWIFISGMTIPLHATLLPLFLLFRKMHIINNPLSILIPYIVFALPTGILILTNAYASLPIEMEESACIDGCNIYQLFWKIMFPLVKPTVAAIALFTFLSSWNELMFAMTFISEPKWKTLTIGLQSLSGMFYTEWGPIGAGMVVATAPVLIIYLLLNRQVQNALIMGAVKG